MIRSAHPTILRVRAGYLFAALLFISFSMLVPPAQGDSGKYIVYIGTYTGAASKGIYAYRFDATTGEAKPLGLVAESENPSFLAAHPNRKFLYAVNEIDDFEGEKTGSISAFAIDQNGRLTLLNRVSSRGAGPAHLSLDKTGHYVLVANYGSGSVAALPIQNDGRLGEASGFIQHTGSSVDPQRQTGPHAHAIVATNDNRFVLVPDLGLDKLLIHRFDAATGSLTPNDPGAKTEPGAGPRHVVEHPSGQYVYLANEMRSTVSAFSYDALAGSLRHIETLTTLPKDFRGKNSAGEILTDARGRFLYLSNRGHDSIVVFAINPETGRLSLIQDVPSGGKTPRNFAFDPTGTWLFAAHQNSGNITLFRVDRQSGRLASTNIVLQTGKPVCVTFVPASR